jgi:hypothetical protein
MCDRQWQDFDRDVAPQLEILGLVNLTHSTPADTVDDAVMQDGLSGV